MVEHSFRTMKQSHLEIRPVFLRREDRTKAHVFVTMMACMIEKKLSEYWSNLEITVLEGIKTWPVNMSHVDEIRKIARNRIKTLNNVSL